MQLVLTAMGLAGVAALFLPFTWGTSPVDVAFDWDLWMLAQPFFLAVLVLAGSLRWALGGSLSRWQKAVAYTASAAVALETISSYLTLDHAPGNVQEWFSVVLPIVVLVGGALALRRVARSESTRAFSPVLAMEAAYLANAALCLSGFFGGWEVGAYCALATSVAYLLQIVLVRRGA
jgi:hypothetical protein